MKPLRWSTRRAVLKIRLLSAIQDRANRTKKMPPDQVKWIGTSAGKTKIILFKPRDHQNGLLPVYVNMHGGGFILGSAASDNPSCEKIANRVGCLVVNIEYKLAPEHRFPVAVEECYDVVRWISQHASELQIDPARIAIGGHSAGGNLATVVCLLARQRKEFSIACQILDYPPLDLSKDPALKTRVPPGSPVIPPSMACMFDECYIGSREAAGNPLVSPVREKDLRGMPPALIITAEQDSLAEEGELYAKMLADAGVAVMQKQFAGVGHGFTLSPGPQSEAAWDLIFQQLIKAFSKSP